MEPLDQVLSNDHEISLMQSASTKVVGWLTHNRDGEHLFRR